MIVEYTKNGGNSGGGSGDQMISYLLQNVDHKGEERESVRVVSGDAELLKLSLNSGRFTNEYTSLVLNFGSDKLSKDDERDILESFLDCSFPSLPAEQRPSFLAVMHDDEHMHISISKEDPVTHKKINPYVHSIDMKRVDAWKRMTNAKYGFDSDPNDPKNISFTTDPRNPSSHPFSKMYHKNKDEFVQNIAIAVKRKLDSDKTIKTRDDIIKFIENGLKIKIVDSSRNESISVENKIKTGGQNIRLKGFDGLFNKDFDGDTYKSGFIEKLSKEYKSKREERYNTAKLEYEQLYSKKAEFITKRYSTHLKNEEINSQFENRLGNMSQRQQTKEELNYREKFIEARKQEYKQQLLNKKHIKHIVRDKIAVNQVRKRKVSTLLKNLSDQLMKERIEIEEWYQKLHDDSIRRLHEEELTKIAMFEKREAFNELVQSRINEHINKAKEKNQKLIVGREESFSDYVMYCENSGKMSVSSLVLNTSKELKTEDYFAIVCVAQKILYGDDMHMQLLYSKFDNEKKKTYITLLNSSEHLKTKQLIYTDKYKQKELKDFFKVKDVNVLLETLKNKDVEEIKKQMENNKDDYYRKYDTKSTARAINRFDEQFKNDAGLRRDIKQYRELIFTQKLERNERCNVITQQQARISARRNRNAERGERINARRITTTFEKLSNSYIKQAKQLKEIKKQRNKNNGLSL